MSDARLTFDATTGDHILTFTEAVPNFWTRRDGLIQLILYPTLFGALGVGIIASVQLAITILVIGGLLVFFCGGWNNKFPCTVTANQNSGEVTIASEYRLRQHGPRKGKPHVFDLDEVASVERSSYADEYPATIASWSRSDSSTARSNLSSARDFWVVRVIFDDGQEINAAWQASKNDSALLQKAMRDMFAKARESCQTQRVQRRQTASLPVGDAAL